MHTQPDNTSLTPETFAQRLKLTPSYFLCQRLFLKQFQFLPFELFQSTPLTLVVFPVTFSLVKVMREETESKAVKTHNLLKTVRATVASPHECLLLDYISVTIWSKNYINAVNSQPYAKD